LIKKIVSINIITNLFVYLGIPETPRVEHRDVSHSKPPPNVLPELWREPDSKPTFSFMLRPRLIQEGVGVKLICCVNGKPQPKVYNHS
jgi:hypothetical protein